MPKILAIDDDKISRALIKFGLKAEDYEVITARDGREGLQKLKEEEPDLIILDIMMPNVNGYEFMAELKKIKEDDIPPVLVLTANEKMEEVFRMEAIKGFLVKPINISLLVNEIKSCLNSS